MILVATVANAGNRRADCIPIGSYLTVMVKSLKRKSYFVGTLRTFMILWNLQRKMPH